MISHFIGAVIGHIADLESVGARGGYVDIIVAHAIADNGCALWHGLGCDGGKGGKLHHRHIRATYRSGHFLGGAALMGGKFRAGGLSHLLFLGHIGEGVVGYHNAGHRVFSM